MPQVIDVGAWQVDPYTPFPPGSHPKTLFVCPETESDPLHPGWHYMLKQPVGKHNAQIWSEVIAYEVSRFANVDVPPCFLAVDSCGNFGALVEMFTRRGRKDTRTLADGADLMIDQRRLQKRLRPHSVVGNINLAQDLEIEGAVRWWAKTFAFDALIGNVDRHPGNWGVLTELSPDGDLKHRLAPAFDNGSSLGYEFTDQLALDLAGDPIRLAAYTSRGWHDCSWNAVPDKPLRHLVLCQKLATGDRMARESMMDVIRFDVSTLEKTIWSYTTLVGPAALTPQRATLMCTLLKNRQNALRDALRVLS